MATRDSCVCGWYSTSKDPRASSRAVVSHMKRCTHRERRAAGVKNLAKRGISHTDVGGAEGDLLEPPQKVPRLSVVRISNGDSVASKELLIDLGNRSSPHRRSWLRRPLDPL
jgi:hypothetical protein